MVIGIVGIVLLSRLHEARWANWRQTGLHWKVEDPSCRKKGCPCARSKKSLDFNPDRKSTRLNSSHLGISYAVFCLKKKRISLCRPEPTSAHRSPVGYSLQWTYP